MASAHYLISWIPPSGSEGTLVEYRLIGDDDWTIATDSANPTTLSYYALFLSVSLAYEIRLSSIGTNCTSTYVYQYAGPLLTTTTTAAP